jgi:hypothetical protein
MTIYSMPSACPIGLTKFVLGNKTNQMLNICLECHNTYDLNDLSLDQRLIDDNDFCDKCWKEFMIE